ncbi:MAG: Fe-S cluster assembly protein SufD [Bdellovibrionales bacterium]|nr:Fe-S cluster assembly protein SufD [Bdellovibrionales bacterium]
MSFIDRAKTQFEGRLKDARGHEKNFREQAWSEFDRLGLPDRKNEAWKYSALRDIVKTEWPEAPAVASVPAYVVTLRERYQIDFDVLVLINGRLNLQASVVSAELKPCLSSPQYDGRRLFEDGFTSLAAAVSHGGVRINVPAGLRLQRPVLLLRVQQGDPAWAAVYNEIRLGADSRLDMAELFTSVASSYLRTEISQAHIGVGAQLHWLRLQEEPLSASHFCDVDARLEEAAELHLDQINAGSRWARTSLRAEILGREAEAAIHGISFGREEQHIDQRILVSHQAGESRSSQLFKGVLKDQARGVVNGKIYIAQNAQKVTSSQLNHTLLLSPGAEADTKPELEIYADDVKANHGASIGRMDRDKIFYLISRGIPPAEAQQMLAHAFVGDVLMKISSRDLRRLAGERLTGLLPDFATELEA